MTFRTKKKVILMQHFESTFLNIQKKCTTYLIKALSLYWCISCFSCTTHQMHSRFYGHPIQPRRSKRCPIGEMEHHPRLPIFLIWRFLPHSPQVFSWPSLRHHSNQEQSHSKWIYLLNDAKTSLFQDAGFDFIGDLVGCNMTWSYLVLLVV